MITDVGEEANLDFTIMGKWSTGFMTDIQQIQQTFKFGTVIADWAFPAILLIRAKPGVPVIAIGVFLTKQLRVNQCLCIVKPDLG